MGKVEKPLLSSGLHQASGSRPPSSGDNCATLSPQMPESAMRCGSTSPARRGASRTQANSRTPAQRIGE
eukprot:6404960-Alexandrium_andersonii.AAC.1